MLPRDGLDEQIVQHIFIVALDGTLVFRVVPPQTAEDGRARLVILVRRFVDRGQQAIAQVVVFAHDIQRLFVIHPRVARPLDIVRAVRAEDGRKRAELHPAEEQFLFGVADVSAAVGIHIRDAVLRRFEHGRHLARERIFIAEGVPRPLDGIAVRSGILDPLIAPVDDVDDVPHDDGATIDLFAARLLLIEVPRDVREEIQPERLPIYVFGSGQKVRAPVAVVPPGIQPQLHERLQVLLAVGDLRPVKYALRARDGLGMVVEHHLHAVLVREGEKALHIGEELLVDVVSPALGAVPPVGIDDHVIERDVVFFIIEDELSCLLFGVGIVLALPAAQRGEAHEFAPPRQFHIQAAQLFIVLAAEEKIHVLRVLFHGVLPLPVCGIPPFGEEDARAVGDREDFGRLVKGREFAAVLLLAVGIDALSVFFELHARKAASALGQIELVFSEADDALFLRIGDLAVCILRAVGDKERVPIAEPLLPRAFDAHHLFAQQLHAKLSIDDLFHDHSPVTFLGRFKVFLRLPKRSPARSCGDAVHAPKLPVS